MDGRDLKKLVNVQKDFLSPNSVGAEVTVRASLPLSSKHLEFEDGRRKKKNQSGPCPRLFEREPFC